MNPREMPKSLLQHHFFGIGIFLGQGMNFKKEMELLGRILQQKTEQKGICMQNRAWIRGAKRINWRGFVMKEYKVMTQKDRFFAGKFDPEKLEGAINAYASQGWAVVSVATADFPTAFSAGRQEIIVIFEREK